MKKQISKKEEKLKKITSISLRSEYDRGYDETTVSLRVNGHLILSGNKGEYDDAMACCGLGELDCISANIVSIGFGLVRNNIEPINQDIALELSIKFAAKTLSNKAIYIGSVSSGQTDEFIAAVNRFIEKYKLDHSGWYLNPNSRNTIMAYFVPYTVIREIKSSYTYADTADSVLI